LRANQHVGSDQQRRGFKPLKWILFMGELFFLWVLCNTVFLVPGNYTWERIVMIALAALFSGGFAWFSARFFVGGSADEGSSLGRMVSTPPSVIWIFVIVVATICFTVALLATR